MIAGNSDEVQREIDESKTFNQLDENPSEDELLS